MDPQSNNLYAYVGNNPIDFVDPTGLFRMIDWASCITTGYILSLIGFDEGDRPIYEISGEILTCNTYSVDPTLPREPGGGGGVGIVEPPKKEEQKKCSVEPLTPITDPIAQKIESGGGSQIDTEHLTWGTWDALNCLVISIQKAGGSVDLNSGYRPQAYQDHFRELWDKAQLLRNNKQPECAELRKQVLDDLSRHEITEQPAKTSNHSSGTAFDVSIRGVRSAKINSFASKCGLDRGQGHGGGHHFNFTGKEPKR